ncbi:GntP family permease [Gilvimarinus sp. DA14]|uniref:GntP family permease n=1 Tax=Gilvimarinus sp. DA14 TaxID=2956798 RepID=UPI0020B75699|nr:gluconate:H+ symporter [Gilvimarinus sp. DA14]UTF60283.1 GntP family permease [Gilvimarinus sp. DA14]
MSVTYLLSLTVASIGLLLFLIMVLRLQAFVALLLVSMMVAIAGGVPLPEVASTIQAGMGSTLGYIAIVIGLGTMIGEILQVSGGAQQIANTLTRKAGTERAPWALMTLGLIVAIPVFFEVALILFIPLVYSLAKRTGKSLLLYGLPLVAGIAVAHSFIPPTPGPVAVASLIGADLGWVILIGLTAGIPAAIVGGIVFGRFIGGRIHAPLPDFAQAHLESQAQSHRPQPGFALVLSIILVPLAMILLNTASKVWLGEGHTLVNVMAFVGHPFTALLTAALLAFYFLGTRLGFSRDEVQRVATRSMEPVGMIILLTGAGGVFGKVLITAGVGDALVEAMSGSNLPVVLFAFLVATVVRVSQGSATVSMVTAAGLIAPLVDAGGYSEPVVACVVIAIACGATVLSHVNDSGFWLVKQYMGLTEKQTLASWTILETILGLVGLAVVLVLSALL